MGLPSLLFITNPNHDEPEEDRTLGQFLSRDFALTFATPENAGDLLERFERCFIRNAWPSRRFAAHLRNLERQVRARGVAAYNPPGRHGYVEDKHYLVALWESGMPVIPTVLQFDRINSLGAPSRYVLKPLDGCSSDDVRFVYPMEIPGALRPGDLIQPEVDLVNEVSWFFIDNIFAYAVESAGRNQRWNLHEYHPPEAELRWAKQFVTWNQLPYGLQRIDACRTASGDLLLMEIEDQMPFLSIDVLARSTRRMVCERIRMSLLWNLLSVPLAERSGRRQGDRVELGTQRHASWR